VPQAPFAELVFEPDELQVPLVAFFEPPRIARATIESANDVAFSVKKIVPGTA
jgi:hypothetical protein